MVAAIATLTTREILSERIGRYDNLLDRSMEWLPERQSMVGIRAYTPYLSAPNSWLPTVEERIRASVSPDEFWGEPSSEWLTQNAAFAAIAFFRAAAGLLPTEPYIYATSVGDLVAEFETKNGSMTSVVSDDQTILFVVLASDPHQPIEKVIRRGSNQFRDELRSIINRLFPGQHGKMEPAR
jgi:hypothetical protein